MTAITALTAVSAAGRGRAATLDALKTRRSGLTPDDFSGAPGWVGRVGGIEDHALPAGLGRFDCRNNRLADMALRTDGFMDEAAAARDFYGPVRIAVVLGTSTSGVLSAEDAFAQRDGKGALPAGFQYAGTQDLFSAADYVRSLLGLRGPAMVVSVACASSARAFVDARQWMDAGICDAAVVGGVDTLCRMTLRGFAALDLVSPDPCRPGDADRNGISIGEAGGFALLERPGARAPAVLTLLGAGCSSDGHHMSSPHPGGAGAAAAMRAALSDAGLGPDEIDYVNLHGTGTRANDAAEDLATEAVFGPSVPCSSTKGWTGHTLGASGVLEAVVAAGCLAAGLLPGALGVRTVDPAFRSRLITGNIAAPVRRVASSSFGFGGVNCTLVFGQGAC